MSHVLEGWINTVEGGRQTKTPRKVQFDLFDGWTFCIVPMKKGVLANSIRGNVSWIDSDTGKLVPKLLQVAPGGSWCASTYLESKILQGTLGAVMRNVFSLPTKWFL